MKYKKHKIFNYLNTEKNIYIKDIVFILFITISIFFITTIFSYNPADPIYLNNSNSKIIVHNLNGVIGAYLANKIFLLFGNISYFLPLFFLYTNFFIYQFFFLKKNINIYLICIKIIGAIFVVTSSSGISYFLLKFYNCNIYSEKIGGILGKNIIHIINPYLNSMGTILLLLLLLFIGITLFIGLFWLNIIKTIISLTIFFFIFLFKNLLKIKNFFLKKRTKNPIYFFLKKKIKNKRLKKNNFYKIIPSIELLDEPKKRSDFTFLNNAKFMSSFLEKKILEFGFVVKVINIYVGPIITRYELKIPPGFKTNKIINLSTDIARSLSVVNIRFIAIIPGKPYLGLEIPNKKKHVVQLKEVLSSEEFLSHPSSLAMGLGLDVSGIPKIADLSKMPHLLIAGTTGSGKSMFLNAILLSMLLKNNAKKLQLIMIDPKILEFSIYQNIPHLLSPIITKTEKANNILFWSVKEMNRRYKIMAKIGIKNILEMHNNIKNKKNINDNKKEIFPYIIIFIDEFSDLISENKQIEKYIIQLSQKARASGIHLILSTQRPSVNIITGVIKANISTRISFQVSSKIDSKIILDQQGAERLLGNGDMLYLKSGKTPIRIHGPFVSNQEIKKIVNFFKKVNY